METGKKNLYSEVEEDLLSAGTEKEKNKVVCRYINHFMNYVFLLDRLPSEKFINEVDLHTRVLLSILPQNVCSITLPSGLHVSREVDLADELKLRWTLGDLKDYAIRLSLE